MKLNIIGSFSVLFIMILALNFAHSLASNTQLKSCPSCHNHDTASYSKDGNQCDCEKKCNCKSNKNGKCECKEDCTCKSSSCGKK